MQKKIAVLFMALILTMTGFLAVDVNVQAEEIGEEVNFESILTEDALIGYAEMQTWGLYLAEGTSAINNAGGGKIGAGGVTNASRRCTVGVDVIVERQSAAGNWVTVTSFSTTNQNALIAIASRTLSVGSGYWYRVRSIHSAGPDGSSSCTDALRM